MIVKKITLFIHRYLIGISITVFIVLCCEAAAHELSGRGDPDTANWNIETLDTARDADYMTPVEKDIILEINKVRSDPKKYAELYIRPRLRYFDGNNYSFPGEITLITNEGTKAVSECAAVLARADAVGILTPERGLYLAAKELAVYQSRSNKTGHSGSGGSTLTDRCARHGRVGGPIGEIIHYGSNTGREIVISFLINDGSPSRGHRKIIMSDTYTQIGASTASHPEYRNVSVAVFANRYVGK